MDNPIITPMPHGTGEVSPHCACTSWPSTDIVSVPITGGQSMPQMAPAKSGISSKKTPWSGMLSDRARLKMSMSMSISSVGMSSTDIERE